MTRLAKTTKWRGRGRHRAFCDSANWTNGVPGDGDIAVVMTTPDGVWIQEPFARIPGYVKVQFERGIDWPGAIA